MVIRPLSPWAAPAALLYALVESAVDYIHNFASDYVNQKQVGSIAHPLKARLRRRQAKGGPITVIISRREQQRRQHRADRPAAVGPAAWIDEWGDVNRVKWTTVIDKAPWRSTGTLFSEFAGTWFSEFARPWSSEFAGIWSSEFSRSRRSAGT